MNSKPLECFISYSHKDTKMFEEFINHFSNIQREFNIEHWYDGKIAPGNNIDSEIYSHLSTCDIVFLLISPSYISSEYCYCKELESAIKRYERGECLVIPVVIKKYVEGNYLFSKLKLIPKDGRPVNKFRSHDDGFVNAFASIRKLLLSKENSNKKQKTNAIKKSKSKAATPESLSKNAVPKYKIVRRGSVFSEKLTQYTFDSLLSFCKKLNSFYSNSNRLLEAEVDNFEHAINNKQENELLVFYKRKFEDFFIGIAGYIQSHFTGCESSCIHFRYRENNKYKGVINFGYRKLKIPINPINAEEGMIECAKKNRLPVIKNYNRKIHLNSHPDETIKRNYITFYFSKISEKYGIDTSFCISIIEPAKNIDKNIFTVMSLIRFDLQIEEYFLKYFEKCAKISKTSLKEYDIREFFKYEV